MKTFVLGASGGVGKHLVRLACDQGHIVTALVRRADGIDSRARILIDDVLRPGCFDDHVRGHEVVLSALGIKQTNPANPWSALPRRRIFPRARRRCSRTRCGNTASHA